MKCEPEAEAREPGGLAQEASLALSANGEASLHTASARDRWSPGRGPTTKAAIPAHPIWPVCWALGSVSYFSTPHCVTLSSFLSLIVLHYFFSHMGVNCAGLWFPELLKLQSYRVVQHQAHLYPGLHVGRPQCWGVQRANNF